MDQWLRSRLLILSFLPTPGYTLIKEAGVEGVSLSREIQTVNGCLRYTECVTFAPYILVERFNSSAVSSKAI